MKRRLREVALPMRRVFRIAHGKTEIQTNLIVELQDNSFAGYREGASLDYYGSTARSMHNALESVRGRIESASWTQPSELWHQMLPWLSHNRFALCALDEAAYDLWGKKLAQPVYKLLGLRLDGIPLSNYTIGIESCLVEEDVARCHGFFHAINIKLTKAGGLTPARLMIDRARALGMKVMVGCMYETSVAISGIAQLLPLLDYVDMDGAQLLAEDIARGVRVEKGPAIFPNEYGNGVSPLPVGERAECSL